MKIVRLKNYEFCMSKGPGRYGFLDYLRFGSGLQAVTMVTIVTLAHFFNQE